SCRTACSWNSVYVDVSAPRGLATLILRGVRELATVGRKCVALAAAKRSGRNIVFHSLRHVCGRAADYWNNEEMRSRVRCPGIPLAIHQVVGDMRLHEARIFMFLARDVARIVRAIGIDRGDERNLITSRRPHGPACSAI